MMLAAAAERTKTIRLSSAVTVLSSDDPVRVYSNMPRSIFCPAAAPRSWRAAARSSKAFRCSATTSTITTSYSPRSCNCSCNPRQRARHLAGRAPRAAARPGGLSPHAEQNPDLGRGRRQSAVGDPRRHARSADGARHHRRHAGAVRAVRRSVPRGRKQAGHDADKLPVGINTHGYVAETSQAAADEFFPSYAAQMTHIGRERGWPPTTRAQFDAGHLRAASRGRLARAGDRENPVPARSARPSALSHADERRHHAARPDHAFDRAVRNEGRARGARCLKEGLAALGRADGA